MLLLYLTTSNCAGILWRKHTTLLLVDMAVSKLQPTALDHIIFGHMEVFPVIYGEIGTTLLDPRDLEWIKDIELYMANTGVGRDGEHDAIQSWFWWSWNANNGDTGGILESNWLTINYEKVKYLVKVGLRPWYERKDIKQ